MATLHDTQDDSSTVADLHSFPGADTRQWISTGIVCPDVPNGAHAVTFNDASGTPHPQGVLVNVTLQPSGITVPCRVGAHAAGPGEGEYSPFGPGDEVVVAVPEGNERAGCIILCRLSNSYDTFPTTVGGSDITQNNVSFRRIQTPYILETSQGYMVRSATTHASFAIDPLGKVFLNDGSTNALIMTPDMISLQEATGAAAFKIDPSKLQVAMAATSATQFVLDKSQSSLLTKGTFTILTSGANVAGHGITVEQACALIEGFMTAWGLTLAVAVPTLGIGALIAATVTPLTLPLLMAGGIEKGAVLPLTVETGALASALANPPDPSGTIPGVGRVGLLY
jgi:hypothetical protein